MRPQRMTSAKKRDAAAPPAPLGVLATYAVPKQPWDFDKGFQFVDPIVPIKRDKKIVELELHATQGSPLRGTPTVKRVEKLFPLIPKAPLASQLEILALGNLSDDGEELEFTRVIDGLRKLVPKLPALRTLRIGKHRHWSYDRLGDIAPLWRVSEPQLRLRDLRGRVRRRSHRRVKPPYARSLCDSRAHGRDPERRRGGVVSSARGVAPIGRRRRSPARGIPLGDEDLPSPAPPAPLQLL